MFQYVFRFFKDNEKYSTYKKLKSNYFITRNTIDHRQANRQPLALSNCILSPALFN